MMQSMIVLHLIAETTTTIANDVGARNNAALPAMFLAVLVLGGLALAAPKWARRINARRGIDT